MNISQEVAVLAKQAREQHQKLVLATGVFDVLHDEHRHFLESAKREGDVLVVGLEPDRRVRSIKGESRPVNDQQTRQQALEGWGIADAIFILPENFGDVVVREALIKELRPAVLAVSSHTAHQEEKRRIMKKFGGKLKVVYPENPAISSTKLLNETDTNQAGG